jgi:regulatory protein
VNVYVNGRFAFGLAAIVAVQLKVGQALSDGDIARLGGRDEVEKAYERALNFLSYRPRSESEVRRNLRKKGLEEETIEAAVGRLLRAGLLDDAEFARYWVENRRQFNPRGGRALRHELRQRGVPEAIIDEAVMDLDEEGAARTVAQSAAHRYQRLPSRDYRRRMGAYLARRGFSYAEIKPLIDELLAARSEGCLPEQASANGRASGVARSDTESEETDYG